MVIIQSMSNKSLSNVYNSSDFSARQELRSRAYAGDPDAQQAYAQNSMSKGNSKSAIKYYKMLFNSNKITLEQKADSQFLAGLAYLKLKDNEKAMECFKVAAQHDHRTASRLWGQELTLDRKYLPAVSFLAKAAQQGDKEALEDIEKIIKDMQKMVKKFCVFDSANVGNPINDAYSHPRISADGEMDLGSSFSPSQRRYIFKLNEILKIFDEVKESVPSLSNKAKHLLLPPLKP